ncbi:MAG TPA: YbhB/YbcL family Raf kinase inhibitor-like protein [Blastocatellia bacterium]|nr:YbhB/YbcL family Raf kinase inhibitor-like protein [Blastocatellia bacterium]
MTPKTNCRRVCRPLNIEGSFFLPVVLALLLASCSHKRDETGTANAADSVHGTMVLKSSSFQGMSSIPSEYTCDGPDQSPDLEWSNLPPGTKSLAVICEDPDAPGGTFTHWVVYDIPATETGLPESVSNTPTLPDGARQGKNDFDKLGYGGPCPPSASKHRYFFRIYALDTLLDVPGGASRSRVQRSIESHKLGEGMLAGTYRRR